MSAAPARRQRFGLASLSGRRGLAISRASWLTGVDAICGEAVRHSVEHRRDGGVSRPPVGL